jgi:hypothetical protein
LRAAAIAASCSRSAAPNIRHTFCAMALSPLPRPSIAGRHRRTCSCPRSAQPGAALSSMNRPARSRNSLHRKCARFSLARHRDSGCRSPAR